MKLKRVQTVLQDALDRGVGSGMAASFGRFDDLKAGISPNEIYLGRHGHVPDSKRISADSWFDLASLTKVLGTTLLAMIRVERDGLSLESTLGERIPEACAADVAKKAITLRSLLNHSSGLPAWRPVYERLRTRHGEALRSLPFAIRRAEFDSAVDEILVESPLNQRIVYSDVGFLLLERVLSTQLDVDLLQIFSEVEGLGLHFRPIDQFMNQAASDYVFTESCPWRGLLQGQVHDDNAWARGGIAGHTGLFGRLQDLQLWIRALLSERWVSRKTLTEFSKVFVDSRGARRALGFDVPSLDGSGSTGVWFSPNSIGHLGFTGTSLWLDFDAGEYAILLTNRVHPSRTDDRIRILRREFHEQVRAQP